MISEIQATKLSLKKTATASYDRWLPNGRLESCTIDQAEPLQDVAQELLPYAIRFLGLDAKAWEPTGRITQVSFSFDDEGNFGCQWEITRTVMDDEFSENQSMKTAVFSPDRLRRYPEVYTAANKIQQAIVQFVNQQPKQGELFQVSLEVNAA